MSSPTKPESTKTGDGAAKPKSAATKPTNSPAKSHTSSIAKLKAALSRSKLDSALVKSFMKSSDSLNNLKSLATRGRSDIKEEVIKAVFETELTKLVVTSLKPITPASKSSKTSKASNSKKA